MARYNLTKIGTKYLTSTGLVGGIRCAHDIDGLDKTLPEWTGPVVKAMSGAPKRFARPNTEQGKDIFIRLPQMATARRDEILTELSISSGTVQFVVSGPSGAVDYDVFPGPEPLTHGPKTREGRVYDVQIHLIVESEN